MTTETAKQFLYDNGSFKAVVADSGKQHCMIGKEGKERYTITFVLKEGPQAGKTITFYGGLSGNGVKFTLDVLKTCGWDETKYPNFTEAVLPKEVVLVLMDESYTTDAGENKTNTRVKYVNSVDRGPDFTDKMVPPSRAKELAAAFTEAWKANRNAGKEDEYPTAKSKTDGKVAKKALPSKEADSDDDIPF